MRLAIVFPIIQFVFVFVFLFLLVLCFACVYVEMLPDVAGDSIPHHVVSTAHRRTELARRSQNANWWMHKCTSASAQMHKCTCANLHKRRSAQTAHLHKLHICTLFGEVLWWCNKVSSYAVSVCGGDGNNYEWCLVMTLSSTRCFGWR